MQFTRYDGQDAVAVATAVGEAWSQDQLYWSSQFQEKLTYRKGVVVLRVRYKEIQAEGTRFKTDLLGLGGLKRLDPAM